MANTSFQYVITDTFDAPGTVAWNIALSLSETYLYPHIDVTGGVRYLPVSCVGKSNTIVYNMVAGDTLNFTCPSNMIINTYSIGYTDEIGWINDPIATWTANSNTYTAYLGYQGLYEPLASAVGKYIVITLSTTTTVTTFNNGVKTVTEYPGQVIIYARMFYNAGSTFRTTLTYTSQYAAKLGKCCAGDYTVLIERANKGTSFYHSGYTLPTYSRTIDKTNATITHTLTYDYEQSYTDKVIQYPTKKLVHNDTADYAEYYAPKLTISAGMVEHQADTDFVERGDYIGVCVHLTAHKHVGYNTQTTATITYADLDNPNVQTALGTIETANTEVSEDYWYYFPSQLDSDKDWQIKAVLADEITTQTTITTVLCYKPTMSLRYEKGVAFLKGSTRPNALEIGADAYFNNIPAIAQNVVGMLVEDNGIMIFLRSQSSKYEPGYVIEIRTEKNKFNLLSGTLTNGRWDMWEDDIAICFKNSSNDALWEDDGLTCVSPSSQSGYATEAWLRARGVCTQAIEFFWHGDYDTRVNPTYQYVNVETTRFNMRQFHYYEGMSSMYIANPYANPNAKVGYSRRDSFSELGFYDANTSKVRKQASNAKAVADPAMIDNDEGYSAVADITLTVS